MRTKKIKREFTPLEISAGSKTGTSGAFLTGFTLVEMITASVILSAAVLTLGAIGTRSLSETKLNRHYELAAALADRQLTLIDHIGIENFIESGRMEGDFEEFEPTYHWQVATGLRDIDNLYLVNITVSWIERNRLHSVSVDTMLNGTGGIVVTEEIQE